MLELMLIIGTVLAFGLILTGVIAYITLLFDSRNNKRRKKAGLRVDKSPY